MVISTMLMKNRTVNPSTPQHKCWGLLRVDPERRFLTPPSKAGLGAAEWVKNKLEPSHKTIILQGGARTFL